MARHGVAYSLRSSPTRGAPRRKRDPTAPLRRRAPAGALGPADDAAPGRRARAPEFPERPLKVLRLIAVGSALAHGRMQVADFDLALVGHVVMSSAGNNLPRILRGILTRNGAASTPELVETSGLTHPTVRNYMRLLGERGVAVHTKASPETVELIGQC